MLTFSYDLTEGFEASESKLGKMTYNHYFVQKLFREQGIMNELITLLDVIEVSLLEKNPPVKESLKIAGTVKILKAISPELGVDKRTNKLDIDLLRKIVNVTFKILRNCCKFNSENAGILFKSIEVFIKYLSLGTYA